AYSFGWEQRDNVPPGSSLIEIDLLNRDGGTLLRLTHSGLPDAEECTNHEKGWTHYLGRLGSAAVGGDPGPDKMRAGGRGGRQPRFDGFPTAAGSRGILAATPSSQWSRIPSAFKCSTVLRRYSSLRPDWPTPPVTTAAASSTDRWPAYCLCVRST